jgi:hypothetical protein
LSLSPAKETEVEVEELKLKRWPVERPTGIFRKMMQG